MDTERPDDGVRFWQVTLTFEPEQHNIMRKNLFGTWRVFECAEVVEPTRMRVEAMPWYSRYDQVLRMNVARRYNRGCIVNPIKLALEFLRHTEGRETIQFGKAAHG